MPRFLPREKPEPDERRVIVLEFIAAAAVFATVALVLYMVFAYRPA